MLAIHPSKETPGTIHLLPCHVKHTGSANATKHWIVNAGEVDGTKVAHFRGRKLVGKPVSLPEGYSGHILAVTDEAPKGAIEKSKRNRPMEEEGEEKREVKVFKGLANFDDVVVWGHDIAPEEGGEYVVKGMNEWVGLASKIHSFGDEGEESD
ncbi:ribonuclease H2, subunit C [Tuber indicum]|nr:ribonuclease H2, subunit C [Tuber indicum]